jgi:hypothetical protein
MLALGAGLVALGPRSAWWVVLALPLFFIGLLGVLQAREGT